MMFFAALVVVSGLMASPMPEWLRVALSGIVLMVAVVIDREEE